MPDDPRDLGGQIAGPGGPYDRNGVVIDMTNAVLLGGTHVALVEAVRAGEREPAIVMSLRGRINQTEDMTEIVYVLGADGAAALITELIGLASRAGGEFQEEFKRLFDERLKEMPL